jgi:hypothetical protein
LGYQGLYYAIKKLGSLAEIENLTPHQLRHTFATMLMLKQMDSIHARTLTRHKSESSFKRYAKRAMAVAAEQAFFDAIGSEHRPSPRTVYNDTVIAPSIHRCPCPSPPNNPHQLSN